MIEDATLIASYFQKDHDRLDHLFQQFQEWKRLDAAKGKGFFKDFFQGLKRHIVWEEEVLFPLFEAKAGIAGGGPTEVMRQEHREIGSCLEAIHDKVRQANPESDAEEKTLVEILGEHNYKEENVLYPAIDRITSSEEKTKVFQDIEAIPEEKYKSCCQSS